MYIAAVKEGCVKCFQLIYILSTVCYAIQVVFDHHTNRLHMHLFIMYC